MAMRRDDETTNAGSPDADATHRGAPTPAPAARGLTRRRIIGLAGGAVAGALALPRPGRAQSPAKTAPEMVVGLSIDPGHLDPRVEAGVPGWSIFHHMSDPMLWRDEKSANVIPWLVLRWEQVNPTTMRWTLRKGVKFHNGEDFTSETIRATFEQYSAAMRSPFRSQLNAVKQCKIVDAYTVDLVTERPNRPLLRNSTQGNALSPRAIKELGEKYATSPVGTGQMKFVEYRPGQHIVMEPNPNYWGKKTSFSRLRFRFIPENGTRLAALETGEVMMINNVPPDQVGRLRGNANLQVVASPTNRVMFVTIRTDRKPFTDKRVRQAMNYAVDREALTKGLLGGTAPISRAPLPAAVYGFHDGLTPYRYDPEQAKKLLAEAGATGATFNFGAPNGRYLLDKQIGEAIAGYLEAVGFKVVFENPSWSTFVSEVTKFDKAKYDGYLFGWGVGSGEPDQLMGEHFHSANAKRTMLVNAEVDRLIVDARESFDDARVRADYRKAQEILWDECPWIWLYEQPDMLAFNKKLKGFAGRRDEYLLFWNASLEG